jgi:hypothetical protein
MQAAAARDRLVAFSLLTAYYFSNLKMGFFDGMPEQSESPYRLLLGLLLSIFS